ncbi:PQQ-like domain protein [Candidatus Methanoperedenaceae archaeon GB37]|nr:PQQ-like domain protein [Candidatus Methanoperedenaceae archaeon GB37]
MNIGRESISRFGKGASASLLAMIMVLSIALPLSVMPVAAADPFEWYLVPQDSTGTYGADTLVELRADITSTEVWGCQIDLHFDTSCVNITDIDFTGNPFSYTDWSWQYNGGDEYVRVYMDQGGAGNLAPGTYTLATYTLHGESPTYCVSDLAFQNNIVSTDNGDPIQNSYTDGTYTCGTPPAPEWPQFHYDIANTGNSPSNAPDDNTTKWISDNIGAVTSSQAMIVGDKVFVYAGDDLYALNKASGAVLWNTSITPSTTWGAWQSPGVDGENVFIGSGSNVYCMNADTGAIVWTTTLPAGSNGAADVCDSSPTIADGLVYIGDHVNGIYYALDEATGAISHTYNVGGNAQSTVAVDESEGLVFFGDGGNQNVYCALAAAPGTIQWTTPLSGYVGGSVAIDEANDIIYLTAGSDLYALEEMTGNLYSGWTTNPQTVLATSSSTPALAYGNIYVSSDWSAPGNTFCFDASTGALVWSITGYGSWTNSPAAADGKIFTGKIDTWSGMGTAALDPATGATLWTSTLGGSAPSVAEDDNGDGMVVTVGDDGKVYAFGTPESVDIEVVDPTECVPRQSQFNVPIVIDTHGLEVYGVQYVLSFNSSVLRAETQVQGDFLSDSGADETIVVINTVDNTAGETEYAETRSNTPNGIAGAGTIATVTFTAIGDVGSSTTLNLSEVLIVDNDEGELKYEITNSTVQICINEPPVANAIVYDDYNNVGSKYLCKVYFDASASNDPDGNITYYRWDFGDGDYGTGMLKEHVYTSWNWNGPDEPGDYYEPFHASLTVTDDTPEPETGTNTTYFDVIVYIAGDANGDGIVNIIDASMVGLEWQHTCTPPGTCWRDTTYDGRADKADLNNDHEVNILDAVIIGTTWKHTAWGDV